MVMIILRLYGRYAWSLALVLMVVLVTVSSASAQITVTGALIVERAAAPGETYQGAITIRNTSNTAQTATLSLADYRFTASGSNSFDAPGSHLRSNTPWITLSQQAVSIPPQGTQVVGYTITVPAESSPGSPYLLGAPGGAPPSAGTYWSVVLVEGEDRSAAPVDPSRFAITPKIRFAVQLVTHLGQSGECTLVIGNPRITPGAMAVDVTGRGTRACRPNLKLEVYDAEGVLQHTAMLRGSFLYPDTSTRQTFTLTALTPGAYSFLVLADVGTDKLQGARFQVQVK
jgi:hypothetical protein